MSRRFFSRTFRPGQVRLDDAEDIRQEIELYLDLRTEELVREGVPVADARRIAEERFGDTSGVERRLRRQARRRRARRGTLMTMSGLRQDLGYALRTFGRSPVFTLVAVLTLALTLGGNTAIFSVVDAALIRAMPFADAEELVYVNGYHLSDGEVAIRGASYPEFYDWQRRSRGVSPMAAVAGGASTITGEGAAESVATEIVTADYFRVLRAEPSLGRPFTPEEHERIGAATVVLISHGFWERRYGRDPGVVGRDIVLDDRPWTIVGVMPPGFGGTALDTDLWIPESMVTSPEVLEARGTRFLSVIGRLTTHPREAQAELDVIARDLQAEWPEAHDDRYAQIQSFRDAYLAGTGGLLWVLLGAGVVLLLIAAANVSNLLLVRSHARTREIVLRRALGAGSGRLAGQLLTEGMVLATLGGVVGMALAVLGLEVLTPMIPGGVLPGYVEPHLSTTTFLFSLAILGVVGTFMGLAPAASTARVEIASTLRDGGHGATGSRRRLRAQHGFVVAQVAMALVLMVGAGLLTRSFRAQLAVDTGTELEGVVAMRLSLPSHRYDADGRRRFVAEMERLAGELPGVASASVSLDLPFRGGSYGAYVFRQDGLDERIRFHRHMVTPGYFETLGIDLVAGRLISEDDRGDAPGVGVITEAMARRVFPDESPIGQTMYLRPGGDPDMAFEVVGIVEDVRYRDLTTSLMADRNSPDIFLSYYQIPSSTIEVAARVRGDPGAYISQLRSLAATLDPDLPVFQAQPLADAYRAETATPRLAAFLMGLLGTLALILACVGIYGVLAFTVGQRAQEIAIRRAIGANASRVARGVLGDSLRLVVVGLAVGGVGAMLGAPVLEGFLFAVPPTDPVTFVSVGGAMVAVALLAAVIPAMRAASRDPAEVLASE